MRGPFFTATTFFGDDHLFLAFARLAHDPLLAFVPDRTAASTIGRCACSFGGCWRAAGASAVPRGRLAAAPPRAAWWGVAVAPSAGRRGSRGRRGAHVARAAEPEAASWFSATTDLLATDLGLPRCGARARRRLACSSCDGGGVPLQGVRLRAARALLRHTGRASPSRLRAAGDSWPSRHSGGRRSRGPAPHGPGRVGRQRRARRRAGALVVQFRPGWPVFTGDLVVPLPLAWWRRDAALALWSAARRSGGIGRFAPFAFVGSRRPPPAAGLVVGARYDYCPPSGSAGPPPRPWRRAGSPARHPGAALLLLGALRPRPAARLVSYDGGLRRRAVPSQRGGAGHASSTSMEASDLDLAIKEDPALAPAELLVLGDVPASFAIVPPGWRSCPPLLAAPPFPPSGAYRFGESPWSGWPAAATSPTCPRRGPLSRPPLHPLAARAGGPRHRPRRHRARPPGAGRQRPRRRQPRLARLTVPADSVPACPCRSKPVWSCVDDDSVMQWPVVELAEWEELRQCPGCSRFWLAAWPEELEGGMILCTPAPPNARRLRDIDCATTLRSYCLARLEEHFPARAEAGLPEGRLRPQAARGRQPLRRAPDRPSFWPPPGPAGCARASRAAPDRPDSRLLFLRRLGYGRFRHTLTTSP